MIRLAKSQGLLGARLAGIMLLVAAMGSAPPVAAQAETKAVSGITKIEALRGPISIDPSLMKLNPCIMRGVFILQSGSVFPVVLLTRINSGTAKLGDRVDAMTVEDISFSGYQIAPKGSHVTGWISAVNRPRNVLESKFSSSHWLDANGSLSIHFSSIETVKNSRPLRIEAQPAPMSPLRGVQEGSPLCVLRDGTISPHWNGIKYGAAGLAISAASWATGPFRLVTGPVISGTMGAMSPAYAYDKPVEKEDGLTRTKAGLLGAVKGLPGGFLVTGVVNHGGDVTIPAGAELQIELTSDLVIPQDKVQKVAATP